MTYDAAIESYKKLQVKSEKEFIQLIMVQGMNNVTEVFLGCKELSSHVKNVKSNTKQKSYVIRICLYNMKTSSFLT